MPPFRLEGPDRPPAFYRKPKTVYTKNLYSEGVKVEHWQESLEHHPIDVDPYCQGKVNYFLSHYERLGTSGSGSYRTTTQDMLEQRFIKDKMIPNKLLGSFFTYCFDKEDECVPEQRDTNKCPTFCVNEFMTTMQHSYQMPKPYVMQRLAFPKIAFMQNRKVRHEMPDLSTEKFYDEDFRNGTCLLRKHKGFRWTSYNPMIGEYTKMPPI